MGKLLRNLLLFITLLALLLWAAPQLIPSETLKRVVEAQITRAVGMPVEVADVSFRLLPSAQVHVMDLQLGKAADHAPMLHAGSGSASLELMPLLSGELQLNGIDFTVLAIRIPQYNGSGSRLLHINRMSGQLHLNLNRSRLKGVKAELYGGEVNLDAEISRAGNGSVVITGRAKGHAVEVGRLLADLGSHHQLSGALSAELDLTAGGTSAMALLQGLQVDGPVRMRSGKVMLNGITAGYDLIRFNLQTRGMNHSLSSIEAFSPLINATGDILVTGNYRLSGRLQAAGMPGLAGEALVGGTVDQPQLIPVAAPAAPGMGLHQAY
ncbi:AsmA family protein [Mariprofundus sp. KV]|uniref:AsmA family protein n=1 Tax=Mariprofundus sp. KV TaxID=2608715 RepID=UPI00159FBBEE|nr:AsmA family protein [Mariprofundus sp. KV]NWF35282.1 AsmA family protein [Mariprofundus sp. KV]